MYELVNNQRVMGTLAFSNEIRNESDADYNCDRCDCSSGPNAPFYREDNRRRRGRVYFQDRRKMGGLNVSCMKGRLATRAV